jgi:drug/metabolite transporter (DMT)-like permease
VSQEPQSEEVQEEDGVTAKVVPGQQLQESGPGAAPAKKLTILGVACTLIGGILWGFSGTCSKILMDTWGIGSLWLVAVRQLFAGSALLIMGVWAHRDVLARLASSRRDMLQLVLAAFAGMMLNSAAYLNCVQITDSGTATVLQSLSIAMVLVYLCLRTRTAPSKREVVGLLLALLGVYLICTHGDLGALRISPSGLFWGFFCALGAALMSVVSRRLLVTYGSTTITGLMMLVVGTVLLFVVQPFSHMPALDAAGWGLLAFTVVFGTVAAYGLYFQGVKILGAYKAGLLGTIEPVTATVASVLLTGTSFVAPELAGFAAIILMVFLTS